MTEETQMTLSPIVFSGDVSALAKAFVAAQKATEAVKKAATNPHFKSKYADLAEVVEATVPALNDNGIGVMQSPGFDGKLVSVTTVLLHESGATATATLHMNPTKSDPQGVGSAITYARRYALLAMTGAAPEDDDGQAASQPRQQTKREEPNKTTIQEQVDASIRAVKNAKTTGEVDDLYKRSTDFRASLDKVERTRLEQAMLDRAAEIDGNDPFGGGK